MQRLCVESEVGSLVVIPRNLQDRWVKTACYSEDGCLSSKSASYVNCEIGHENPKDHEELRYHTFGQYEIVVLREASIFRTYGALVCHATLLPNGHRCAAAMGYGYGAPPVL